MKNLIYLFAIGISIMSCKKDDNINTIKNHITPIENCTTQAFRNSSDTARYNDARQHIEILELINHTSEMAPYIGEQLEKFVYEGTYIVVPAGTPGPYTSNLVNRITLEFRLYETRKNFYIHLVQFMEEVGPEHGNVQRSEGYSLKDVHIEDNYIKFKVREICDEWTLRK